MYDYCVLLQARAAGDEHGPDFSTTAYADLADLLWPLRGVLAVNQRSWSVRMTVDAPDAFEAIKYVSDRVIEHANQAHVPPWQIVRVECVREDVLELDLTRNASTPFSRWRTRRLGRLTSG